MSLSDTTSQRADSLISPHPVNKLLATLPLDDYRRLLTSTSTVPMKFRQVIYKQDETITDIYFPGGGACSLTKTMTDGATAEIATVGNEGALGTSVFFGDDRSFSDLIVQVADGAGLKMPVRAFLAEMERKGAFYNRIIRYSQALTSQIMQTTVCNGLHTAEQRCCRWLLMTRDRVGHDDLKLTHEFLAIMLGVRRPTVTLVLHELQRAGLIDAGRATIRITNQPGLERASCECYGVVKSTFHRLLPEIPRPTG
jgi:CRP-like cAMP-binding protein